jgi:galactokinase
LSTLDPLLCDLVITATAPGRVNLIGEHTDYNGGFVLPVALPLLVTVELQPRGDRVVRAISANAGGVWHEVGPAPPGTGGGHGHGAGAVHGLEAGGDVRISSDIPMGAGLGSSGALGVALLRALREAFGLDLDDVEIAKLAQRIENEHVGASSGIMDQMAASLGTEGEALFLDCRSLTFERIPLPAELELVVVHSGVTHEHSSGQYNVRRRECEEAARALGVRQLRDAGPADRARIDALPEPLSRRARHVVSENARVLGAVAALRAGDLVALGELLDGSHRSLRDDYEVSTPEIDLLVELVREQEGVHGARITGGGFGGSIAAIADVGAGHRAAALAVAEYEQRTGRDARILLPALSL